MICILINFAGVSFGLGIFILLEEIIMNFKIFIQKIKDKWQGFEYGIVYAKFPVENILQPFCLGFSFTDIKTGKLIAISRSTTLEHDKIKVRDKVKFRYDAIYLKDIIKINYY